MMEHDAGRMNKQNDVCELPEKLKFGKQEKDGRFYLVIKCNLGGVEITKTKERSEMMVTHNGNPARSTAYEWPKEWKLVVHNRVVNHGDLRHCKQLVQKMFDAIKSHKCNTDKCVGCNQHGKCLLEWWYQTQSKQDTSKGR